MNYPDRINLKELQAERALMRKLRDAIQFCKEETDIKLKGDQKMTADMRMTMEKCLVENYLMKHGMDYFGKRDLIYIDMMGTADVDAEGGPDRFFWINEESQTECNNYLNLEETNIRYILTHCLLLYLIISITNTCKLF